MEEKRYFVEFYDDIDVDLIKDVGGKVRHTYKGLPKLLSAVLSEESYQSLLSNDKVRLITEVSKGSGSGQILDWGYTYTGVNTRYKNLYTGQGVNIAILDTGMSPHEDLPTPVAFKDFVNGRTNRYDDNYHGTFIAGIIAAKDNNIGTIGVAPDANLYIGKVLDNNAQGTWDDILAGLVWAMTLGVDIINFSIYAYIDNDPQWLDVIRWIYDLGIIIVACSGNGTDNNYVGKNGVATPAKDYSCVGVGSIDSNGTRSSFSNYGTGLDLVAPGDGVISAHYEGDIAWGYGTSFSTAYVTGHLACLKEKYPSYGRDRLISELLSNCIPLGSSFQYGAGCVNADPYPVSTTLFGATTNGFNWMVGVSSFFNQDSYIRVGICNQPFTNGQGVEPNNIVAYNMAPSTGTLSITYGTITGQSPNTTYTLYGFAQAKNGLYYTCGFAVITTKDASIIIEKPGIVQASYYGDDGFSLFWEASQYATSYELHYYYLVDGVAINRVNKILYTNSVNIMGLTYGRTYYFTVRGINDFGTSEWSMGSWATIKPQKPIITSYSPTPTSIRIGLNLPEGLWDSAKIYQYTSNGITLIAIGTILFGGYSYVDFTNLVVGNSYLFKAKLIKITDQGIELESNESEGILVVVSTSTRPSYFSWTTPKVGGEEFKVLASEWKRLVQNVKDMHEYKKGVYNLFLYPMYTVEQGDIFYADRFNEVRFAIESLNPTNLQDKVSGDPIKADDLNLIVQKLNEIS